MISFFSTIQYFSDNNWLSVNLKLLWRNFFHTYYYRNINRQVKFEWYAKIHVCLYYTQVSYDATAGLEPHGMYPYQLCFALWADSRQHTTMDGAIFKACRRSSEQMTQILVQGDGSMICWLLLLLSKQIKNTL